MVTVTKTYNLEIKGNLFAFTEAEAQELFNALDSVLNGKTYPRLEDMIPTFRGPFIAESTTPDPWQAAKERHKNTKYKL